MIDLFVQLIIGLNSLLFGNLGLTVIVIGVLSRALFYPFYANSIRYSTAMRDLKPKLDELRKKYGKDMRRMASEQSKLFKQAGVSPAAGALGCLSIIIQIGVFFLLFQSLNKVVSSGIDTQFLLWDLAKPDTYSIQGLPLPIPGVLLIATAIFTFIQSKMMATPNQPKKAKESKGDFASALSASQGQMMYFIPLIILVSGSQFASGLALYWFVSTLFGIIQQYNIAGLGGLEPWLKKSKIVK